MGVALAVAVLLSAWAGGASAGPAPPPVGPEAGPAAAGVTLVSSVFGNGGAPVESAHRSCVGTLGQPSPIGIAAAGRRTLYSGFWGAWQGEPYFTPVPEAPPPATRLYPNRPNPFNPATTIVFDLGQAGFVRLTVHDLRGQVVRRLVAEARPAGRHGAAWDGRDDAGRPVASGLYVCRLETPGFRATTKIAMVK